MRRYDLISCHDCGVLHSRRPVQPREKARCVRCHRGDDYTSKANYDVKWPSDGSRYDKWNPPTLRGVFDRGTAQREDSGQKLPTRPDGLRGADQREPCANEDEVGQAQEGDRHVAPSKGERRTGLDLGNRESHLRPTAC